MNDFKSHGFTCLVEFFPAGIESYALPQYEIRAYMDGDMAYKFEIWPDRGKTEISFKAVKARVGRHLKYFLKKAV